MLLVMSALVVDASIIATAVADGGTDGVRYRKRLSGNQLFAPHLLRIEVLSVLRRRIHLKKLTDSQGDAAVDDLMSLAVEVLSTESLIGRIWELRHNVTAYDACYVAMAESLGCVLLTADARLANASGPICEIELL